MGNIASVQNNKACGHLPENINPLFTNLIKTDVYLDAHISAISI